MVIRNFRHGLFSMKIWHKWKCIFLCFSFDVYFLRYFRFHIWYPIDFYILCHRELNAISLSQLSILFLHQKNASREGALCFNQWKAFPENSKPIRDCYGLFTKILKLIVVNLKTTCHLKLKFFLSTKILEILPLARTVVRRTVVCQFLVLYFHYAT